MSTTIALQPPPGLPECGQISEDQTGACYVDAGARGYAAYSAFRGCFASWLSPPGFHLLPDWLLAIAYLVATIWLFMGVAIAADIFMDSILVITSATRPVYQRDPATGKKVLVGRTKVWNWVVSTLTLMALGSSAPEILLSVIETLTRLGEPAGKLGPAVVVGAAAFNVFNITLACTAALPTGTTKRISQYAVFLVTAAFALWGYAWLALVYDVISPGRIEVYEAALTLAFFPALVVCAWLTDKATNRWRERSQGGGGGSGGLEADAGGLESDVEAPAGRRWSSLLAPGTAALVVAPHRAPHNDSAHHHRHHHDSAAVAARRYSSAVASRLALLEARAGHDPAAAAEMARDSLAVLALAPRATTTAAAAAAAGGAVASVDVRKLLGVHGGVAAPLAHVRAASYAMRPGGSVSVCVVRRHHRHGAAAAAAAALRRGSAAGGGGPGSPKSSRPPLPTAAAAAAAVDPSSSPWLRVRYSTEDADAVAGVHYSGKEGSLLLAPGDAEGEILLRGIDKAASRRWPDGTEHDGSRSFFLRVDGIDARAGPPPAPRRARTASGVDAAADNDEDDGDDDDDDAEGWVPSALPADVFIRVDIVPAPATGASGGDGGGAPAGVVSWERPGIELRGLWAAGGRGGCGGGGAAAITVEAVLERSGIGAGPGVFERACAVRYSTRDGSALAGLDYRAASGEVRFRPGETSHVVRVKLLPPAPQAEVEAAAAARRGAGAAAAPQAAAAAAGGEAHAPLGASRTFALVLSDPSDGCSVAPWAGGSTLRITMIPSASEAAAAAALRRTSVVGAAAAAAGAAAGGAAGGGAGAGGAAAVPPEAAAAAKPQAAAAEQGGKLPGSSRGRGYPLRERWLAQFRDAICFPPPPPVGEGDGDDSDSDDDGGDDGGGGQNRKVASGADGGDGDADDNADGGGGSDSQEEAAGPPRAPPATRLGLAMHLLTVVFKFLLASVPPADYAGGWPAFIGALMWIGALIAVIEQTANSFGCAVMLPQLVVGIVVVAAGTTVPDTWASIVAARHDADADAAIANAFGSCAVNVFLGLGLPWTIASSYQAARGLPFEAPSGDLAFSVALFCGLAGAAILLLFAKRVLRGGELGGPTALDKYGTCACLLGFWVTYVAASGARAVATDREQAAA